ncbi:hypothetical protein ISF98_29175 [Burkholderia pseudomallei]|nr:hypothetical protein [Burkholderia pseudomallei]
MTVKITISTPVANRKELAEAFGENQSAVRRLEAMTRDITINLPGEIQEVSGTADDAFALAHLVQTLLAALDTDVHSASSVSAMIAALAARRAAEEDAALASVPVQITVEDGFPPVAIALPAPDDAPVPVPIPPQAADDAPDVLAALMGFVLRTFATPPDLGNDIPAAVTATTLTATTVTASTPIAVSSGGTGDSTLTAHGVLIGEGTSPIHTTTAGTTGQMLLGSTGADPAFGNNPTISGGTIDNAPVGGTTASSGKFTTLSASGNEALTYGNASGQSIPNNTATDITNWTKIVDRLNANFNATTGVYTAPATGYYLISAQIIYSSIAPAAIGDQFNLYLLINSSVVVVSSHFSETVSANFQPVSMVGRLHFLNAGDTVKLQAFQNSGSTDTLVSTSAENWITITQIP